jgi:hypothetical protein
VERYTASTLRPVRASILPATFSRSILASRLLHSQEYLRVSAGSGRLLPYWVEHGLKGGRRKRYKLVKEASCELVAVAVDPAAVVDETVERVHWLYRHLYLYLFPSLCLCP